MKWTEDAQNLWLAKEETKTTIQINCFTLLYLNSNDSGSGSGSGNGSGSGSCNGSGNGNSSGQCKLVSLLVCLFVVYLFIYLLLFLIYVRGGGGDLLLSHLRL
jgi:hypothetical protein